MSADELPAGDDMLDAADEQRHDAACGVSDIPEIERLRRCAFQRMEDDVDLVPLSSAESAIRSALDRQAREIVEALRDLCPSTDPTGANDYNEGQQVGWTDAADLIADRYLHGRDEFDGAGCCPEEDGWLRARSRARLAPKEADPR